MGKVMGELMERYVVTLHPTFASYVHVSQSNSFTQHSLSSYYFLLQEKKNIMDTYQGIITAVIWVYSFLHFDVIFVF